ncbi:hypothetical protein TPHA_0F00180 [Tetrapisispora phaffii CBS 4417]|uniref:Uncharacterized protein n=1 Tax=Tetrapisispora phaffii (strain ATCC 24235 / CBS 4417 / NBRC 1672 / NRRL Y-8282 / UCD 70-5) TaxID=1071381 RepID=G8BUS3_TETPH|nr:hypothetical protein TPHA_0F00180 [Tetrapisispora phaffii CBS 4417]CCE63505.1 hypothetical protein TPHA_0F00180 [Tetrapisispora phaffii CBS 4417]
MLQLASNQTQNCPFWDYDDLSMCSRSRYINLYLPSLLLLSSVCYFSVHISFAYYKYNILRVKQTDVFSQLCFGSASEESEPLLNNSTADSSNHGSVDKNSKGSIEERHFTIQNLDLLKLNGDSGTQLELVKRNYMEKLRVIIEFILVLSQTLIQFTSLKYSYYNEISTELTFTASMILSMLWTLLLVNVCLRLTNLEQNKPYIIYYMGNLWTISFISYFILTLFNSLIFRSVLLGHIEDNTISHYYVLTFSITALLTLMLFFAPIRNSLPIDYKTHSWITASPESTASLAKFITWGWLDKFLLHAYLTPIEAKDIMGLILEDYSIFSIKLFKTYAKTFEHTDRKFSYILMKFFINFVLFQTFWATISAFVSFVPTILLQRILLYVEDSSSAPANLAWFYVFCMFLARATVAVSDGLALFFGRRICIRMRSIIISEIYSKALRRQVSNSSDAEKSKDDFEIDPQEENDKKNVNGDEKSKTANLGAIINLMAVDTFKIADIGAYMHFFAGSFIMTIIALVLLYKLLGVAAIVGTILLLCMIPVSFKLATLLGEYQKKTLAVTDQRIQKLNEVLQAIRIIKFFSWEGNFEEEILTIREKELKILLIRSAVWALGGFVWYLTPTIVTAGSFAYYIFIQGEQLTTPVAFTALSLFSLLRGPLDQISDMASFVIQSKVSLDRIQKFLDEDDTKKYEQLSLGNKISLENVTVSWNKQKQDFKLRNLNIDFKVGKLNVVIGPTGSGKTSLLMALLGEMHLLEGKITVPSLDPRCEMTFDSDGLSNSMAYCSQAAWLLNDTVKNNILFNAEYNEERYLAVISACALKRDFEILAAGDLTEIGERGITLSGGQKQRISLARALYSSSKHILLDDCLSAVDSHTAAWIYDNCIIGPLMENRTCILVSHNVALTLKNAEQVIMIDNGKISHIGDPLTLLNNGVLGEDEMVKSSILSRHNSSTNLASKSATNISELAAMTRSSKILTDKLLSESERAKTGKLIKDEAKAEGHVDFAVYRWFLDIFGGVPMLVFLLSIFLLAQFIYVTQSWWVRYWVTIQSSDVVSTIFSKSSLMASSVKIINPFNILLNSCDSKSASEYVTQKVNNHTTKYYLIIYFAIGLAHSILGSIKTMLSFYVGINASRKIFKLLLSKVLHSKLRFFDSTPIGRIMNRFSKDIEAIDQELTPYVESVVYNSVQLIATVLLITYITNGFIVVALLVILLYYFVGVYYLSGSRELKRFESTTKSPIYQHFSETLVGVTTIRAYGDEIRFMKENLTKIDENNKPFFYLWVANRWLCFRIDIIGSLVIFGAGVLVLMNINKIDSGLAGISLTYAITFTESALWLVRSYSNVEINMNSVERVKEYMDIEQEPYSAGIVNVDKSWPSEGKIEVNDLSLRYAPSLPKVIKNVSFTVEPKMKVGVVGRTGAGKSTIITALFRFLDPETGYIKIDNIDITTIDLKKLRKSITIIPQDPTLFTGTIKSNLDPYNEYNDDQIFKALRRVNLIVDGNLNSDVTSVSSENVNKFLNLQSEISEGGSNLSQGQRQLMCLARSLLRAPNIMLLDEATASIDYASDAKIQGTIRNEFKDSTILTIAHRLRSVIDYDKILVMDAGEVKEYDHPYSLLLNKNSIFYSMCEQSGELDTLIDLSKEAFVNKLNSK